MEISQHIKNLLRTNERVILGGFGTFITKHISAQIDKESKVMKPPFKIVTFDENITEDAGLLIKYMAEKEQISIDNAKEQIEEYVKTIKSKLSAGKTVEFKDLGSFKQNADNKIEFSYLAEDNLLLDSFGLPTVKLTDESKLTSQPIERKKPIEKTPDQKPVVKKEQAKQPIKKVPPIKKEKPVRVKKPVKIKSSADKPKKKRKWLAVVIPIAAILIMLSAIYFFKPDLWDKGYSFSTAKLSTAKEWVSSIFKSDDSGRYDVIEPDTDDQIVDTVNTEIETDTDTALTEDINELTEDVNETVTDTEVKTNTNENVVENVTVNKNPSSGKSGRYYIIVSSVTSQSSAQKEQQRFARKGIETDIIHIAHINKFRLSIGDFGSAKEAQNYFADFQAKHGNISAWVWENK